MDNLTGKLFSGRDAFKLYDTYGFPLELTQVMAREKGIDVDVQAFEELMKEQKQRARESADMSKVKGTMGGEIEIDAESDADKMAMARHHSSTHLLHAALHQTIGKHATQSGSQVSPDKLRFDFKHFQAVTSEELEKIEDLVNEQIGYGIKCDIKEMDYDKAIADGSVALFGEKYGDQVRRVAFGDFSKELCGGTHVENTAEIKAFKIVSEGAIAAGTRRIEAVAGDKVSSYFENKIAQAIQNIQDIEDQIKKNNLTVKTLDINVTLPPQVVANQVSIIREFFIRIDEQFQQKNEEIKLALKLQQKEKTQQLLSKQSDFLKQKEMIGDIQFLTINLKDVDTDLIKDLANSLCTSLSNGLVLIANEQKGKTTLFLQVAKSISSKFNAKILVKDLTNITGGGGGGSDMFAQAGIKNSNILPEAISALKQNLNG